MNTLLEVTLNKLSHDELENLIKNVKNEEYTRTLELNGIISENCTEDLKCYVEKYGNLSVKVVCEAIKAYSVNTNIRGNDFKSDKIEFLSYLLSFTESFKVGSYDNEFLGELYRILKFAESKNSLKEVLDLICNVDLKDTIIKNIEVNNFNYLDNIKLIFEKRSSYSDSLNRLNEKIFVSKLCAANGKEIINHLNFYNLGFVDISLTSEKLFLAYLDNLATLIISKKSSYNYRDGIITDFLNKYSEVVMDDKLLRLVNNLFDDNCTNIDNQSLKMILNKSPMFITELFNYANNITESTVNVYFKLLSSNLTNKYNQSSLNLENFKNYLLKEEKFSKKLLEIGLVEIEKEPFILLPEIKLILVLVSEHYNILTDMEEVSNLHKSKIKQKI